MDYIMKRYRIVYYHNAYTTEMYVREKSKEAAIEKWKSRTGDDESYIINIEVCA